MERLIFVTKTIIIIPARYQSTRFPGKPLAMLTGGDGVKRSLIERSWRAAQKVSGINEIYIATDDQRIANAVQVFGGNVLMTPQSCQNGTERCAAALEDLDIHDDDIIINLQGDAPLTPSDFIENIITEMKSDPECQVATPILRCDLASYENFIQDRRQLRVGGTTAVKNVFGDALYFSKEVLPFSSQQFTQHDNIPVYHHVGLYGYRPQSLKKYIALEPGLLELQEGLEQLRFLEHGIPIRCVEVEGRNRVFWELNNPIDIERIETALKNTNNNF